MSPEEMRRRLVELALRHVPAPTIENVSKFGDAYGIASRMAPFIAGLPDDDPQLVEMSSLVETGEQWEDIAQQVLAEEHWIWDQSAEYRVFLEGVLRFARVPRE
jgi:hypothetical protein